jgi:hypothetical protein
VIGACGAVFGGWWWRCYGRRVDRYVARRVGQVRAGGWAAVRERDSLSAPACNATRSSGFETSSSSPRRAVCSRHEDAASATRAGGREAASGFPGTSGGGTPAW